MSAKASNITAERIRYLYSYDAETGDFVCQVNEGRRIAGTIITGPTLVVDGEEHKLTRFIWLHYYGEWPPLHMHVDHKNRIKADNWIDNLRLATPTQNQLNKSGSGTYPKGVTWRDRIEKPWQAKIRVDGVRLHLGSFATMEEAAKAYQEACLKYHGEFACLE